MDPITLPALMLLIRIFGCVALGIIFMCFIKLYMNHSISMKQLEIDKIRALDESKKAKELERSKQDKDLDRIDELTEELEKF
jgi:uncharacterized membrane protein